MSTTMEIAMKGAGIKTGMDLLKQYAIDALVKYPRASDEIARVSFFNDCLRGDPTWHLMDRMDRQSLMGAIRTFLRNVAESARIQQQNAGKPAGAAQEGHGFRPQPGRAVITAPAVKERAASITSVLSAPSAPSRKVFADMQAASTARSAAVMMKWCSLDIPINGSKLRELTFEEAGKWARKHQMLARFIELLSEGMQPSYVVGKMISNKKADEMYKQAEAEYANAA